MKLLYQANFKLFLSYWADYAINVQQDRHMLKDNLS